MVDKPTLDGLLVNLREYVGELRRLAATPRERFVPDAGKIENAKYHFKRSAG